MKDNEIKRLKKDLLSLKGFTQYLQKSQQKRFMAKIDDILLDLYPYINNYKTHFFNAGYNLNFSGDMLAFILTELKRNNLIQITTTNEDFTNVFITENGAKHYLFWRGGLRSLAWFVDCFCSKCKNKWVVTKHAFIIHSGGRKPDKIPDIQQMKNYITPVYENILNNTEPNKYVLAVEEIKNKVIEKFGNIL